ncbi:MAG: glycosyltransferase family 4 protein [Anaerolineae bacterium]|nr:glycosyltransferase family 4 protein [Anaerolineae bacterium]
MTTDRPPRIAVIFARFGPYHLTRLEAAGRYATSLGGEVIGVEVARRDSVYQWDIAKGSRDFHRVTVFEDTNYHQLTKWHIAYKVYRLLGEIKPDAVALPGWVYPEARAGLAWCSLHHKVAIVMSASTRADASRVWWREWLKSRIIHRFDAALVGGTQQSTYIQELGMPADRIFTGYNAVDNAYFASESDRLREKTVQLRADMGLPSNYFLSITRFVPVKNLLRFLEAYALYRERAGHSAWDLVLCGDGPLKSDILQVIADKSIGKYVHLPGFIQYDVLPTYYALANAFILPSVKETWGLVVNEAMACGLPVLVSNRCGCAPDLVKDGVNGYTFDPYNTEYMADRMLELHRRKNALPEMGCASREIISEHGPHRFAQGLWQAMCVVKGIENNEIID